MLAALLAANRPGTVEFLLRWQDRGVYERLEDGLFFYAEEAGGALSLIDIALFATVQVLGTGEAGPSVTLELSTQFVGAGNPDQPLDAVTEIVRETGRMVFLRGQVVQGDSVVAGFSGIVRKLSSRGGASA